MWAGRTAGVTGSRSRTIFNSSIRPTAGCAREDITWQYGARGDASARSIILPAGGRRCWSVIDALQGILDDPDSGRACVRPRVRIDSGWRRETLRPASSRKLHTARSRNIRSRSTPGATVRARSRCSQRTCSGARRAGRGAQGRLAPATRTCSARSPSPSATTWMAYADDAPARYRPHAGCRQAHERPRPSPPGACWHDVGDTDRFLRPQLGFDDVARNKSSTAVRNGLLRCRAARMPTPSRYAPRLS